MATLYSVCNLQYIHGNLYFSSITLKSVLITPKHTPCLMHIVPSPIFFLLPSVFPFEQNKTNFTNPKNHTWMSIPLLPSWFEPKMRKKGSWSWFGGGLDVVKFIVRGSYCSWVFKADSKGGTKEV